MICLKPKRFVISSLRPKPANLHRFIQALKVASADYAKATKTAEAKVVREKETKIAEAKAKVSSLSAELTKASKKAKAEL